MILDRNTRNVIRVTKCRKLRFWFDSCIHLSHLELPRLYVRQDKLFAIVTRQTNHWKRLSLKVLYIVFYSLQILKKELSYFFNLLSPTTFAYHIIRAYMSKLNTLVADPVFTIVENSRHSWQWLQMKLVHFLIFDLRNQTPWTRTSYCIEGNLL